MAPKAMQIDTPAKAAAAACVASIAILAGQSELFVLLFLLVCLMVPAQSKKECQRLLEDKHPRLSAVFQSWLAKACVLALGAALLVIVLGWSLQTATVLISAGAYVFVHELSRLEKALVGTRCLGSSGGAAPSQRASGSTRLNNQTVECHTKTAADHQQQCSPKVEDNDAESPTHVLGSFDAEVKAFVRSNMGAPEHEAVLDRLVHMSRECILPVVPEADLSAVAAGSVRLTSGSRPEVNLSVTVDASILSERLKALFAHAPAHANKNMDTLLPELLQITATKVLSERLTFARFWRSDFKCPTPKVVLRVPSESGLLEQPLHVNFRVGISAPVNPLYQIAQEKDRAEQLYVVVTRWARQRCIANIAKGHFHNGVWDILVAHYWRLGLTAKASEDTGIGETFKDFVKFYAAWFCDTASRTHAAYPRNLDKPHAQDASHFGKPSETAHSVVDNMTVAEFKRVQDEFARAGSILELGEDATLSELMAPWVPCAQVAP